MNYGKKSRRKEEESREEGLHHCMQYSFTAIILFITAYLRNTKNSEERNIPAVKLVGF